MIQPPVANDLDDVRALLSRCELPTEGLTDQFPGGYVVARHGGAIVGAAGLEVHGTGACCGPSRSNRASAGRGSVSG